MSICLQRREFITLLGGAAVAWPLAAHAQQRATPLIGYLHSQQPEPYEYQVAAFRKGLSEMGFIEGRNVAFEFRWAENDLDRLPDLAADLVRRRVAVIVALGGDAALAAKRATTTIPIVFITGGDPVALGLVASLNRPGTNLTGSVALNGEVLPKRLQLLRELTPTAPLFGVLLAGGRYVADIQAAARILGLQLVIVNARTDSDLEPAFATFSQQRVGAVLVGNAPFYFSRREQLVALAARYALPAIYPIREFALAGGLMSYSSAGYDAHHQLGIYTGRILKGEKPADLPVEQAVRIGLTINLKTAKALGIEFPTGLRALATEVIE
jgi:putative ABC transport system substrate-binding protein